MFSAFEHQILNELKLDRAQGRWLCAVSGGLDSIAGLHLLHRLTKVLKIELVVGHVNHGPVEDKEQRKFRLQAYMLVNRTAEKLNLAFLARNSAEKLVGEASLREFRYSALRDMQLESNCQGVITFHHQDDLLETRLLRLLRGVGAQGLEAMQRKKHTLWRPLLMARKVDLEKYAGEHELQFVEDPSNHSTRYLRNWLRVHWLKPLSKDHPDKLNVLARSLSNLVTEARADWSVCITKDRQILRAAYSGLSLNQQKQLLISHLKTFGATEMRTSQLQEIIRQLDKSVNAHSFKVAGLYCYFNAERIWFKK
jgi:tRNA(Ile)-lysidine synthase